MSIQNKLSRLILPLAISPFLIGGSYAAWNYLSLQLNGSDVTQSIAQPETQFSDVASVPIGTFTYGGSTTWAPIRSKIDPLIQAAHPDFKLQYTEDDQASPGSGTGIKMLLGDRLSFSQSSRNVKEKEHQQAREQGTALHNIPIAIDGIVVAINPGLPVDSLTLEQLRDIYRGRIANWQQVGGPDLEIRPYTRRRSESGTVEFFVDRVMDNASFADSVELVSTVTDGLRQVGSNQGGIYYGSAPEIVPQCEIKPLALINSEGDTIPAHQGEYIRPEQCPESRNQINVSDFNSGAYPLTRRLYVVSKESERAGDRAAKAYAELLQTGEGQRLLQELGFVPIGSN